MNAKLPPLPKREEIENAPLEQIKVWGAEQGYKIEAVGDLYRVGTHEDWDEEAASDHDLSTMVDSEDAAWEYVRYCLLGEREAVEFIQQQRELKKGPKH